MNLSLFFFVTFDFLWLYVRTMAKSSYNSVINTDSLGLLQILTITYDFDILKGEKYLIINKYHDDM